MFITPPDDGADSAEDSGDEDVCSDINKLSGRQLASAATAKITQEGRTFTIGEDSDYEDNVDDDEITAEESSENADSDSENWDSDDEITLLELKNKIAYTI